MRPRSACGTATRPRAARAVARSERCPRERAHRGRAGDARDRYGGRGGSPVRIRLVGLPDEVMAAAERITDVFDLVEASEAYPCRGSSRQVRAYLEVRL